MENQHKRENKNVQKEENWVDEVMERQKKDLEIEENMLSKVPNRIKHKYIDSEDEQNY